MHGIFTEATCTKLLLPPCFVCQGNNRTKWVKSNNNNKKTTTRKIVLKQALRPSRIEISFINNDKKHVEVGVF